MKLLHRTTRDILSATILILLITGIGMYLLLHKEVTDEMNEQLAFQAALVSEHMANGQPTGYPFAQVTRTTDPVETKPVYGDTLLYDLVQHKKEDYHYLDLVKRIGSENYHIKVMTTYIGWGSYYKTIFYLLLAAIILLAASGVLINYFSNRKIWRPFFLNLENLKKYTVSSPTPLQLQSSGITEFKELQAALKDLTERSHREYMALREFTENASHEIQTPLGIIQSKLDRLSQLDVSEEMARYIVEAKSGVERLNKMNKSLLLLAKLDNKAFGGKQSLPFQEIIQQHLQMMEDLFAAKHITINTQLVPATLVSDPYLCEVLVSNLFSNALRYTDQGGTLNITLLPHQLVLGNTGEPLDFPPEFLFDRFRKSSRNIQSTGLGLAIVQQICLLNGWEISYRYEDGQHVFTMGF
jgi:signal transduction histidine kinase